jgi:hypothetical protein
VFEPGLYCDGIGGYATKSVIEKVVGLLENSEAYRSINASIVFQSILSR